MGMPCARAPAAPARLSPPAMAVTKTIRLNIRPSLWWFPRGDRFGWRQIPSACDWFPTGRRRRGTRRRRSRLSYWHLREVRDGRAGSWGRRTVGVGASARVARRFSAALGAREIRRPRGEVRIWDKFYGVGLGRGLVPLVGALETALALAIVVGLWRRLSYGLGFVVH